VNHSFKPNAHYDAIDHPRFGIIASVVSFKPIKKGEEIFTDYHYPGRLVNNIGGLEWYSDLAQSQVAQDGLQVTQEGAQEAQEGGQEAQDGSQIAQDVAQDAQELFKDLKEDLLKEELWSISQAVIICLVLFLNFWQSLNKALLFIFFKT